MINEIVKNVPKYISLIASEIYIIKENVYEVKYDGIKVKYKEIDSCPYQNINKTSVIDNKKIFVFDEKDYKVYISVELEKEEIDSNKKTILIADDSELIIKFCKKSLDNKYNIITASNGLEVIEIIEKEKIDALLLDLMMPLSSGYQVLEIMNEKGLLDEIPTAIISGEDSKDGIDRALKYNVVDMLEKPFSKDKIEALINKLTER